jgi:hypothetical protein
MNDFDAEFFKPGNPLLTQAVIVDGSETLLGYFDILESEFYQDNSESTVNATFVCQDYPGSNNAVGKSMNVQGRIYSVDSVEPDGTGLVSIKLLKV